MSAEQDKSELIGVAFVSLVILILVCAFYSNALSVIKTDLTKCQNIIEEQKQCLKLASLKENIEGHKQAIRKQAFIYKTQHKVDLKAFVTNQVLLKQELLSAIKVLNEMSDSNQECASDVPILKVEFSKLESEISSGVHYYMDVI